MLITRKDLPANNFKEFVSYAKANQTQMQFGSAGAGSATHLGCVLLNYRIGVNVTHVPYRGTGPAMQDLQGGRIDYLCEIITTAKPQIDGGTVKGLAILDSSSPALPNLPTAAEQGTHCSKPMAIKATKQLFQRQGLKPHQLQAVFGFRLCDRPKHGRIESFVGISISDDERRQRLFTMEEVTSIRQKRVQLQSSYKPPALWPASRSIVS